VIRKLRPVRVLALTVGLSLIVTGCGSSGSNGGMITPKRFIAEANAICSRADERARALTSGSKLKVEAVGAAATLLEQTENELEKLNPPTGSAAGFHRFLNLARGEIKLVAQLAAAIHKRNLRASRALTAKLNSSASNQAAEEIGLTVCAKEVG
jgi:hypothetical protein